MDWTKIELLDLQSLTLQQHNNLPAVGGIYFCIAQNQLLYIGQSRSLNQRWKNHHRYHELISKGNVNIHWIECDNKKERIEAERLLIKHHKPVLNFRRTRLKIGFSNRRKQHILLNGSVSPNMLFNEMLELYRISAKELSKLTKVSENHISDFRRGKCDVSTNVLSKLLNGMETLAPGSKQHFWHLMTGEKQTLVEIIQAADEDELLDALSAIAARFRILRNSSTSEFPDETVSQPLLEVQ